MNERIEIEELENTNNNTMSEAEFQLRLESGEIILFNMD